MRFHCPSLTSLVYFRRLCDTLLTPVRLVGCLPTPILPNRNFQTGSYPTCTQNSELKIISEHSSRGMSVHTMIIDTASVCHYYDISNVLSFP